MSTNENEVKYVKPNSFGEAVARVGCATIGYPLCAVATGMLIGTAIIGAVRYGSGKLVGGVVGTVLGGNTTAGAKVGAYGVGGLLAAAPALVTAILAVPGGLLANYGMGGVEGYKQTITGLKKATATATAAAAPTRPSPGAPAV